MQAFRTKITQPPSNERNVIWIALGMAVVFALIAYRVYPDLLSANTPAAYIANLIPFVVVTMALVSVVLIWFGYAKLGCMVLIFGTTNTMFIIPFVAIGYALISGLVALVVLLAIATQVYSQRFIVFAYLGGILVAVNILVDRFWPYQRQGLETNVTVERILGVFLIILIAFLTWRQLGRLRLQDKLVLFAVGITLIPLFAVNSFTQARTEQALVEAGNESLLRSASQIAYTLDSFVNHTLENISTEADLNVIVEYLSMSPEERSGSEIEGHLIDLLNKLAHKDPKNISSYALIDNQGIDVFDLVPEDIGLDKSDRDYFQVALQTARPFVSPIEVSPTTGGSTIYFSAPIHDPAGNIIGVISVRYDANAIQQILQESTAGFGQNVSALVIDDKNIIVANTKEPSRLFQSIVPLTYSEWSLLVHTLRLPDKPFEKSFNSLPDLANALQDLEKTPFFAGEVHTFETSSEHGALVRSETQPWVIVAAIEAKTLLAPIEEQARTSLLAGIIAAIIAVAVAVIISGIIAAPINRLTSVAEQVSQGDLTAKAWVETQDEIGTLATTFNQMTDQLSQTLQGLEQRVADRTRAIETSAVVSRRLSTILDPQQLVKTVVEELKQAFQYDHVQVYLLEQEDGKKKEADRSEPILRLAGGTGEAGQQMIANRHRIPYGEGLVGRAAQSGTAVFVPDTQRDPSWSPNPLLPETRAELAIPIMIGEEVLGALDIQHNELNKLSQQDIDLLQSIAGQVAVTLRNARLYEGTRNQAEREAQIRTIIEKIQQTQTVEQALQVAAREIGRSLGGMPTLARIYRPKQQTGTGAPEKITGTAATSLNKPGEQS